MRPRILITGPGGRVGTHLVPLLREHFALRLFDLKPIAVEGDDETIVGDIGDLEALQAACGGVSALLHLAAVPDEDDFMTRLLPANVVGVYNAFEAARLAGVTKVVFTSTAQTVLGYGSGRWVDPSMPARPSTRYACTKLFGEALGRYYSDQHGMDVVCIRLAWFQPPDSPLLRSKPELRTHWCSPADLARLVQAALLKPVRFAVAFGVSNNTGRFWDISEAERVLGFRPQDDWVRLDLG